MTNPNFYLQATTPTNAAEFYYCGSCGCCVIEIDRHDRARELHTAWHRNLDAVIVHPDDAVPVSRTHRADAVTARRNFLKGLAAAAAEQERRESNPDAIIAAIVKQDWRRIKDLIAEQETP